MTSDERLTERGSITKGRTGGPYDVAFALNQSLFCREPAVVELGHFGRFMKKYVQTF